MGVRWWKHCVSCGEPFDIATNFDICPGCRLEERIKEREVEESG